MVTYGKNQQDHRIFYEKLQSFDQNITGSWLNYYIIYRIYRINMIFKQKIINQTKQTPKLHHHKILPLQKPLGKQNLSEIDQRLTFRSNCKGNNRKSQIHSNKLKNAISSKLFAKAHEASEYDTYLSPNKLSYHEVKSKEKRSANKANSESPRIMLNIIQKQKILAISKQLNIKIINNQNELQNIHDISDIIMQFKVQSQIITKIDKIFQKQSDVETKLQNQQLRQSLCKLLELSN